MGVLLLARKPGVVVWCLLPKIILDGGQLVLLYLFGESVIAVDMFLNLTSSNASEASELLGNIFLVIVCVFFFYTLPTLWLATRSIRMKDRLTAVFRKRWAFRSLGLFGVGVLLCFLPSWQKHSCDYQIEQKRQLFHLFCRFQVQLGPDGTGGWQARDLRACGGRDFAGYGMELVWI